MSEANSLSSPDIVSVENLDQFVGHLTGWHSAKVAQVRHLLQIPEGATFEIDGKEFVLAGESLTGFKFGLEMSLMQLGTLPFVAEVEDANANEPTSGG